MTVYSLHFRWTVSRGVNTYGYNIVTLLVDGYRQAQCNGGGYDMQGTVFADWLTLKFNKEMQVLFTPEIKDLKEGGKHREYETKEGKVIYCSTERYYGVTIKLHTWSGDVYISLDGACGFSSMERIANAIGIKMQWNKISDRYKNHTYYTAVVGEEPTVNA